MSPEVTGFEFQLSRGLVVERGAGGDRLHTEQRRLAEHFPQFRLVRDREGSLAATGRLRTNAGGSYTIRIVLGDRYPHELPAVVPVGWDATSPHTYANGELCVMRAEQWRSFYTVAFLVAKAAWWLNKFEVYNATGAWPGRQQRH